MNQEETKRLEFACDIANRTALETDYVFQNCQESNLTDLVNQSINDLKDSLKILEDINITDLKDNIKVLKVLTLSVKNLTSDIYKKSTNQ